MRRRALAGAILAIVLLAAGPAHAASNLEVGLEDERILLDEPAEAPAAVAQWRALGVEVVRLHARWERLAPRDPTGAYDWSELDRAIELLRGAGLKVMLTLTGPGPAWASGGPEPRDGIWEPDPAAFGSFARAVAARYGRDVDRYLIWNEPNIPGWLMPQWDCVGRRCTLAAPHIYRELVRAAVPAIRTVDGGAQVVAGELAPIGVSRGTSASHRIAPLPFLRALGCVDARYRPIRRGRCRGFKPVRADAIGYHPHGVERAPDVRNPDRDEAQIGDLPRLFAVLDRLTRKRRLLPSRGRRFDVHLTEFGYQTSPPDHAEGVTLAQQVRYLQQAAYVAWKQPRVRSLVHYQWADEPVHYRGPGEAAYSGWQSGLLLVNGTPKPAYRAFPHPFVVDRKPRARTARVWGQVRPGRSHVVTLQRRPRGSGAFADVATLRTDDRGYFSRTMRIDATAEYRFFWRNPDPSDHIAAEQYSGVVAPGARQPKRIKAPAAP